MQLVAFRVQMYRCITDSGWVSVAPLTAVVGKNESGKTTLLRALHKLNPFDRESYDLNREWPRGRRQSRDASQVVCTGRFRFDPPELDELESLTGRRPSPQTTVDVSRKYDGQLQFEFPDDVTAGGASERTVDDLLTGKIAVPEVAGADAFRTSLQECQAEVRRLALAGSFMEIPGLGAAHAARIRAAAATQPESLPAVEQFIQDYPDHLKDIANTLNRQPPVDARARALVSRWLPTFISMSDYRTFTGTANLDQVLQRANHPTEEDRTLLMIMQLAGLDLEDEVKKASDDDLEQRQYDLDDASSRLTALIADRWKQRKYTVQLRADGSRLYTFVKDDHDSALIKLEERSKGFQWFFSFDITFMHESQGRFKNCVLLVDEPGLHLHPQAQRDLAERLAVYAAQNTLIYTTHLPFLIDVRQPASIRVINETPAGNQVTEDFTKSQPEGRLVLEAALGLSAQASHLVAESNLLVEGLDDLWLLTELANVFVRAGQEAFPDDLLITPTGGALASACISSFMLGHGKKAVVLLDTDSAHEESRDAVVRRWLEMYNPHRVPLLSLGPAVGIPYKDFSVEDLFPDHFYASVVEEVYEASMKLAGAEKLSLSGNETTLVRVERELSGLGITFDRLPVARALRRRLARLPNLNELPAKTQERARLLFGAVTQTLGTI